MKFSTVAVLAATGVAAQIDVITGVISKVSDGIDGLTSAATSFNGDIDAVKSKADDLNSALTSGKTTVDGSSNLELADAVGLAGPVTALTKKGQTLVDTFKSKIADVEKANACDTVRSELTDINSNSKALIDAVVSKVPDDAKSIASQLADGLLKVLDQAQSDFSEDNCKSSGGSSSSQGSSSTGPAPTSGSSGPSQTSAGVTTTAAPSGTPAPCHKCTGGSGNGTNTVVPPPVTAGASFVAPAGALVLAVAAMFL